MRKKWSITSEKITLHVAGLSGVYTEKNLTDSMIDDLIDYDNSLRKFFNLNIEKKEIDKK